MNLALHRLFKVLNLSIGSLKFSVTMAGLLALVFGIGSSVAVLMHRAEADLLRERQVIEANEASRTAVQLSRRIVDQQQMLALVAARLTPKTFENPVSLRQFLDTQFVLRSKFSSLFVVRRDGQTLFMAEPQRVVPLALNLADRAYFRKVVDSGVPAISDLITSRMNGELLIVFAQPLLEQGKVFGVLAAAIPLQSQEDLLRGVADRSEDDDSALVAVTDAKGLILAHPDRRMIGSPIADEPRLAETFKRWQADGGPVEPGGLVLADAHRITGAAGVSGPDWMVWRSRPDEVVLAPLAAGRANAIQWAAVILLLMGTGLAVLLWWLLRPLSRLEHRAARLFDQALDVHAEWPKTHGEVGRLQNVLKRVAAERASLEATHRDTLNRLESVMAAAPVGIAFTHNRKFELVNSIFCGLFGRSEEEFIGQSEQQIYASIEDFSALRLQVKEAFDAKLPYMGVWEMHRADGHRFWARLSGRLVDPAAPDAGTIWTVIDYSAEVASRQALEVAATQDALTGLANRHVFEERLNRLVAARPLSIPAALILFDLDRFKPVNDSAGHAAGDAMLKAVAGVATGVIRGGDLLVRLGGDEFAVVLERCPLDAALRVAENLREAIQSIALLWQGKTLNVGASLGVVALSADFAASSDWIAEADRACYLAKAAGRNSVQVL